MLRRTIGDAEGTKTAIFQFVNRAYEAKMPDREIGGMFGTCFVRASHPQDEEEAAWDLLEFLGEVAKATHSVNSLASLPPLHDDDRIPRST